MAAEYVFPLPGARDCVEGERYGEESSPAPSKNLSKCCATSQHAGGPPKKTMSVHRCSTDSYSFLPNPVAKPLEPSVASISTQNDPSTLIPQVVRDGRYFSQPDIGVDMELSMSQCPPLTFIASVMGLIDPFLADTHVVIVST